MKNRFMILAAAGVALVLTASVPSALAYFTTYVSAKGEKEVVLKDRTTIDEPEFSNFMKTVKITADEDSEPVFVRARAYKPEDIGILYVDDSGTWRYDNDGWCYYADPISKGKSAEEFNIKIGTLNENESPMDITGLTVIGKEPADGTLYNIPGTGKDGDNFNVVVVYEYTPVLYDDDGNAYADWTKKVEPMNGNTSGGNGEGTGSGEGTGDDTGNGDGTETGGGNG